MKKVITSLLAIFLILCSLCTLTACEDFYYSIFTWETYDLFDEDGFSIAYSERFNDAWVYDFYWNGQVEQGIYIYVPNTYKGAPVTALGGYRGGPHGFDICFYDQNDHTVDSSLFKYLFGDKNYTFYYGDFETNTQNEVYDRMKTYLDEVYSFVKEIEIQDVVVNLQIGSNLQKLECIAGHVLKNFYFIPDIANEVITVYAISFVITVDEQNEYFYSDDLGRMYHKETGELVTEFLYHNRETFPEGSLPTE